ncbi:MAG TPA: ABC transporter ATP-binding protein [Planctomycetota bacterium]|nr:ABC transporter ATP-binding protein [Planctomycetota bacterium]
MTAIVEEVNRTDPPPTPAASEADIHYRPMLAGAALLELCDLTKQLGSRTVLDGVNLAILKGETMTVIGGSGAGKSVLLKHIVGLMRPDRGCVKVNGVDISGDDRAPLEAARRKIGFCFQGSALLNSLSVFENVALPLREHETLDEAEIRRRVDEKLALVGLADAGQKLPAEISGGMKKRVGLARAIIRNPEIILYDEPTAGLDPVMGTAINDLILDMQKKLGVTSVLVTHDMSSTFRVSNRIAMLVKGRIVKLGTPAEFRASDDPQVQQFIYGESEGPLTRPAP